MIFGQWNELRKCATTASEPATHPLFEPTLLRFTQWPSRGKTGKPVVVERPAKSTRENSRPRIVADLIRKTVQKTVYTNNPFSFSAFELTPCGYVTYSPP